MKRMMKLLVGAGVMVVCMALAIAQVQSHKIISVPFTSAGSYTFATTADPMGLESVDMTFTGAAASNTFTLAYVRSNVTHTLIVQTGVMKTCVWLLPAQYYFQTNDRLTWTNSVTNAAVLTVNGAFNAK